MKKTKVMVSVLLLLLIPGCLTMGVGKIIITGIQVIHTVGHLFESKEDVDEQQRTNENIDR